MENIKAAIDRVRYMSLDHVTSPEMLLRQHHEIFTALEKRDAEAVEKAMSIHLHEISESVLLIRQRTATGLVKNKSQTAAGMADAAVVIEGII